MKIHQIWLHPVKSMEGATVEWCDLDELGMVGDRIWAVRDITKGGIRGAKKIGAVVGASGRRLVARKQRRSSDHVARWPRGSVR